MAFSHLLSCIWRLTFLVNSSTGAALFCTTGHFLDFLLYTVLPWKGLVLRDWTPDIFWVKYCMCSFLLFGVEEALFLLPIYSVPGPLRSSKLISWQLPWFEYLRPCLIYLELRCIAATLLQHICAQTHRVQCLRFPNCSWCLKSSDPVFIGSPHLSLL